MKDDYFGQLHDVYQGLYAPKRLWQSELQVEVFKEPLRVSFETTDESGVEPFHYQAFEDFKRHQIQYKKLALEAMMTFYLEMILPLWKDNNYFGVRELAPTLAPSIKTLEELEGLLSCPSLFLHAPRAGVSSLGLSFECTWDVEHGVGVLLRDGRVIQAGLAEVVTYDLD